MKKSYISAWTGDDYVIINRIKLDGGALSEVCYYAMNLSDAKIIIAGYKENKMTKLIIKDVVPCSYTDNPERKIAFETLNDFDNADSISVFIWQDFNSLIPICKGFTTGDFTDGVGYYYDKSNTNQQYCCQIKKAYLNKQICKFENAFLHIKGKGYIVNFTEPL